MRTVWPDVHGESTSPWSTTTVVQARMPRPGVPKQKDTRHHRAGVGYRALAVAVIHQAVVDLRAPLTSPEADPTDAAKFLMDGLWNTDNPWSILAREDAEWLTEQRVDRLVASKIDDAVIIKLPRPLRQRILRHKTRSTDE